MSLEQALAANTAALIALTGALQVKNQPVERIAPSGVQPKAPATPPTTPAAPPTTPAAPPAATGDRTYKEVADVVIAFVKAHTRAPALLLLAPFDNATTIMPFKDKPAELAKIYAVFTDPVKTAAAIAQAAAAPKA